MAVTAIVAVGVGLASTAVQSNQQKIAAQKQKDAVNDAAIAQKKVMDDQKSADDLRKKQEDAVTQAAFQKTAVARSSAPTGANLPGAVPEQAIGAVGSPVVAAKKLIGS